MEAQPGSAPVSGDSPAQPVRLVIIPAPGSLLEQLLDDEDTAKAAEAEAKERRQGLRDRIEAELTMAHPGVTAFDILGSPHRPAKTLRWQPTVRLDTDALKQAAPEIYVQFAKFGGRWELRSARGGA